MYNLAFLLATFLTAFASEKGLRGRSLLAVSASDEENEWKQFANFQDRFSKRYETIKELELRFQIFSSNLYNIFLHNLDHTQNFTMGVNQFTDLTPEEFKAKYVGGLKTEVGSYGCKSFSSNAAGAPDSLDWRENGAVTSVKDQGQCGSCWTFSATGAVEGAWAVSKGQLIDLSEEQLVECATGMSYGSHGCSGGEMDGAFKYVIEHGQCALSAYPYTSGNGQSGSCKACQPVAHITSCSDVKPNDQISLKAAVSQQPVAIAISADTKLFQSYSSGVITSSSCYTSLDHGVLIVGYGTENGIDYWNVKNSWSSSWGIGGYVKIAKSSSTNDAGICGIAMDASFPSV
jgi:KDEL-tailed cysteine endopeptidase